MLPARPLAVDDPSVVRTRQETDRSLRPTVVRPAGRAAQGGGRFVAIEGIDGSGKSTVATGVTTALERLGRRAILASRLLVADETDGYVADHLRALRRLIWEYPEGAKTSELGFLHWAHLLASWFAAVDHTVVRPAVEAGRWVVADSWFYKFVARFAVHIGAEEAQQVFAGISAPDSVVWLDVPPEVCVSRRHSHRTTEQGEWEGIDDDGTSGFIAYQAEVRDVYRMLAGEHAWHVVDAIDPATVLDEVCIQVVGPTTADPTAHDGDGGG
jgi:thymidylate kinase